MMLENLIGSTTKVKILRLFFEYPNRSFTTKEVFLDAKVGTGYGLKCLKGLESAGILTRRKAGREKIYKLRTESDAYDVLEEMFSREKRKYPKVSRIHRGVIAEVAERLDEEDIFVFGSVAAGTATADSDMDLLVISRRPQKAKSIIREIQRKTGTKLQAVVFSREKLQEYARGKDRLLRNVSREHIFVKGDDEIRKMVESV